PRGSPRKAGLSPSPRCADYKRRADKKPFIEAAWGNRRCPASGAASSHPPPAYFFSAEPVGLGGFLSSPFRRALTPRVTALASGHSAQSDSLIPKAATQRKRSHVSLSELVPQVLSVRSSPRRRPPPSQGPEIPTRHGGTGKPPRPRSFLRGRPPARPR